ncbi:hypothetical protein [Vulgatibacter sp.]|uniref:hypothetical protein n=1 Tax=Vulgatibacter sp. TaxID=1971226 RepID=UPI003569087C
MTLNAGWGRWVLAVLVLATWAGALASTPQGPGGAVAPLPQRLTETGLYAAEGEGAIHPDALAYAPQYPLWTDGAEKRRWLRLPPGTAVDASDPEAWRFPTGARFWKEFAWAGRPLETRYMELLADGSWRYATYVWRADGSDADLAPDSGLRPPHPAAAGKAWEVPGVADCRACHQGTPGEILGFDLLQLSPDRDPLAPHADETSPADLRTLAAAGLLRGLPQSLLDRPPRIEAPSPEARAALGYLQGNCASCHNQAGPLASLGLDLAVRGGISGAGASAAGVPSRFVLPGLSPAESFRIDPGDPARSAVAVRIASRDPTTQMPPLGTALADEEAAQLIRRWIESGARSHANERKKR